ncbi:MAG TPA: calcium-binding protein [Solimonas sp.]|nr:calcium-binding protein [Solimonas sp.]
MTNFVQSSSVHNTTANSPNITLALNDNLFVLQSATLTSTASGSPVIQAAGNNSITLEGTLYSGASAGIMASGILDLRLSADAAIYGQDYGVYMEVGGNTVFNSGEINTSYIALGFYGGGNALSNYGSLVGGIGSVDLVGDNNHVLNHGLIQGTKAGAEGIYIAGIGNVVRNYGNIVGHSDEAIEIIGQGSNEIFNAGLIERSGTAGNAIGVAGIGGTMILSNAGTITGHVAGGNNTMLLTNTGTIIGNVFAGGNDDIIDTQQGSIQGTINAGNGNDTILGSDSATDRINGFFGDDLLEGNGGNDSLDGGAGADELYGGAGIDTALYSNAATGVSANLGNAALNSGEATGDSYDSIENLIGSIFDDSLTGSGAANRINGGAGNDALNGADGNDYLIGGAGADTMTGGGGDDTFIFSDSGDSAIEAASGGNDIIRTSVNTSLGIGQSIERVVVVGNIGLQVVGNELNNILIGSVGNDILDGGAGVDTLRGAGGNDSYYVDNASDSVIEQVGDGTDTVLALLSHTLANNIEALTLLTAADINGIGNSINNTITGNNGINQLNGKGGVDSLTGNLGNDTFIFNAGQGNGDTIVDFTGNGAAAGDSLRFIGYGTVAQGATLVQLNATQWQVNSFDNAIQEVINFSNSAAIHASDFVFN